MRAIGMVEFNSIAKGIYAADQMAKISEVEFAAATSTCPGKYIAIVHGDVAAVEDSVRIGERMAGEFFIDSIIIPNVDPGVFPAITGATMPERVQAVGIMESFSLATMIVCADAILKAAELEPIELASRQWPRRKKLLHLHRRCGGCSGWHRCRAGDREGKGAAR